MSGADPCAVASQATQQESCKPCSFSISVRSKSLNAFCKKLAWCCGVVAGDEAGPFGVPPGELVNVCLHVGMTQGVGEDMRTFAKDMAKIPGACLLLYRFSCERRESERNRQGAVVLHATEFVEVSAVDPGTGEDEQLFHSEVGDKGERHLVFARWLVEVFGAERLAGGEVLDVAGGKGLLSLELRALCDGLGCTLVDPAARVASVDGGQDVRALAEAFDAEGFARNHPALLEGCSALVGLHPDQATEAIVDCALQWRKPFAVIPCCVYPSLFPHRRSRTGQGVVSYDGFLDYLKSKDARIRSTRLPFAGRNKVLYMLDGS